MVQSDSRRRFLKAATTASIGATVAPLAAALPTAAAASPGVPIAAKPDYLLDVVETPVAPFGTEIRAVLAGGTWPGPEIRYRKGDLFRVLVQNRLAEPTTIHWHGLVLPNLQDGVPGVTQAPIGPGALMFYEFPLIQAGTYWYHSHFELQEQVGLAGPLIIDDPDEPLDYDHDVTLFLSDVLDQSPAGIIPGLRDGSVTVEVGEPYVMADGQPFATDVPYDGYLLNGRTNADPWTYAVAKGDRLRLRVINGSTSSFFRLKVDGLPLTVIASDGEDLQPVEVDDLMIGTAERYDLLVTVPEAGSYSFHAAALGDDKGVVGVIHTKDQTPKANPGRVSFSGRTLGLEQLRSREESTLPEGPSRTIAIKLSGNMAKYVWLINDVAYPELFTPDGAENVPLKVGYGERVRFEIDNATPMFHPMHLHGHVFRVLGDGGAFSPLKDTLSVPPKSKVAIEFFANNPGRWFWHCHNLYHLASGMAREVHYVV